MPVRHYSFRNYASVAFHYGTAFGIAAATYTFAQPWAIMAAAVLVPIGIATRLAVSKKIFENLLAEHPKNHEHSPFLGEMVKDLYRRSELDEGKYPIYDFKIKTDENQDERTSAFFRSMSKLPNAAAVNIGKPVIIISTPLLKMLDHEEEKAILAHEFAHIGAKHHAVSLPHQVLSTVARCANGLTVLGSIIMSVGFWTTMGVFAGSTALGMVAARKITGNGHLMREKIDTLTVQEVHERKKTTLLAATFTLTAGMGTISYLNPAIPIIWATSLILNGTSAALAKNFSRSNEYQADKGAVALGADPLSLITSFRKLEAIIEKSTREAWGNHSPPEPGWLRKAWNRANQTHPSTQSRIERLAAIARESGSPQAAIDHALTSPVDISQADNIPYDHIRLMTARL